MFKGDEHRKPEYARTFDFASRVGMDLSFSYHRGKTFDPEVREYETVKCTANHPRFHTTGPGGRKYQYDFDSVEKCEAFVAGWLESLTCDFRQWERRSACD